MAKRRAKDTKRQGAGPEVLKPMQAQEAGAQGGWHYGRVDRVGYFDGDRVVTVTWEEGGMSVQGEDIDDKQWEIFKLAFMTTGRIAILSDLDGKAWMNDFSSLEAHR